MTREFKKRNKNHQVGRRQYEMRIIENLLLLSRASAISATGITVTTTTIAIPPSMSNPAIATTTCPSTTSTTVNLFVSNPSNTLRTPHIPNPRIANQTPRSWPRPYMPAPFTDWSSEDCLIEQTEKREREEKQGSEKGMKAIGRGGKKEKTGAKCCFTQI